VSFPPKEVSKLVVACHRRCCICHRFCGAKMELDHITPRDDGGTDSIDNAIPVCFECHAEIHAYNDRHPRGRKYRPEELRQHKKQWLELCKSSASVLASIPARTDVGSLQALIDELEFNKTITLQNAPELIGAPLEVTQFNRCVSEGILSLVELNIKDAVYQAYISIKRVNTYLSVLTTIMPTATSWQNAATSIRQPLKTARNEIEAAIDELYKHLGREPDE
jgi:hypothetical protein